MFCTYPESASPRTGTQRKAVILPNIIRPVRLDDVDRAIVAVLIQDGRIPNKELADRVGLAPSSCLARVRSLIENGVISGFHAEVDPRRIGQGLRAILRVQLKEHSRAENARFAEAMAKLPQVVNLWLVAGEDDYLIEVVASTTDDLSDFVLDCVTSDPVVADTYTTLVFSRRRGMGPMPVDPASATR
jgi:DNA-binding Lrp family transcriptional regulator